MVNDTLCNVLCHSIVALIMRYTSFNCANLHKQPATHNIAVTTHKNSGPQIRRSQIVGRDRNASCGPSFCFCEISISQNPKL